MQITSPQIIAHEIKNKRFAHTKKDKDFFVTALLSLLEKIEVGSYVKVINMPFQQAFPNFFFWQKQKKGDIGKQFRALVKNRTFTSKTIGNVIFIIRIK